MLDARSAIAHQLEAGGRNGADGLRRLRLGEFRSWHLAQLGHFAGTGTSLTTAVRASSGYDLPLSPCAGVRHGGDLVMRIATDQWWVVTPNPAHIATLIAAVPVDVGTVTPLSTSRTRLVLEGSSARAVLAKLVPIDLHDAAFPIGHFAQTGVHHVGGLLYRAAPDRYEYFALRTYAATIWEAVADAALPFGYDAVVVRGEPA